MDATVPIRKNEITVKVLILKNKSFSKIFKNYIPGQKRVNRVVKRSSPSPEVESHVEVNSHNNTQQQSVNVMDLSFEDDVEAEQEYQNAQQNSQNSNNFSDDEDDILGGGGSSKNNNSMSTDITDDFIGENTEVVTQKSNLEDMMMGFGGLDPTIENPILGKYLTHKCLDFNLLSFNEH